MKLGLYFHTLRHMRPGQVYSRIARRLRHVRPDVRPAPPLRPMLGCWVIGPKRESHMLAPDRFHFLNHERELSFPAGWNDPSIDQLWLYNLHYFEDLTAAGADERRAWHQDLVERWVRDNRPFDGVGWDPYPTSLRIANWIKWALAGASLSQEALDNLALATRYLEQRIEYHLLGNHLLANAKALVFAGLYFEGNEAERWLRRGLEILSAELDEQILADGGHFELSPMYHSLMLEDLLDLLNLVGVYQLAARDATWSTRVERWKATAEQMQSWLAAVCLPDGQIGLFGDAAFGIAPEPAELAAYAARLGLPDVDRLRRSLTHLAESGYVRLALGRAVAVVDVGEIGASYIPGHGHADVLTFELALGERRVVVNSGTSVYYGDDRQRACERSTAAHNTVEVDGHDSSELWGNFRVARRAHPRDLRIEEAAGRLTVSCAHDGYRRLRGRVTHRRTWTMDAGSLSIADQLDGRFDSAIARFHLHPEVEVVAKSPRDEDRSAATSTAWDLRVGGELIEFSTDAAACRVEESRYHPQFGLSVPNRCLVVPIQRHSASYTFKWSNG